MLHSCATRSEPIHRCVIRHSYSLRTSRRSMWIIIAQNQSKEYVNPFIGISNALSPVWMWPTRLMSGLFANLYHNWFASSVDKHKLPMSCCTMWQNSSFVIHRCHDRWSVDAIATIRTRSTIGRGIVWVLSPERYDHHPYVNTYVVVAPTHPTYKEMIIWKEVPTKYHDLVAQQLATVNSCSCNPIKPYRNLIKTYRILSKPIESYQLLRNT